MSGTSFLSPADVATITQLRADGFATRLAIADPPVDLVLSRYNTVTGVYDALAAQRVVVSYANRASRSNSGEGAESQLMEGTFEKDLPFDVRVGDRFSLPSGQVGTVTMVPFAQGGIQKAMFTVEEGVA
jgi:hypothetical protein